MDTTVGPKKYTFYNPSIRDTLSIKNRALGPKVSVIKGVDCIVMQSTPLIMYFVKCTDSHKSVCFSYAVAIAHAQTAGGCLFVLAASFEKLCYRQEQKI